MKKTFLLGALSLAVACNPSEKRQASTMETLEYPDTRRDRISDQYFGHAIEDPYRWLEDDLSEDTKKWVIAQNKVSYGHLGKIPYREALRQRLENLWNYEKYSSPFTRGEYTYFYKNDGLQNHSVLYRQKEEGEAEVFLDPNMFSEDGTTSLAGISFTKDGRLAAYQISEGGSDWRKVVVIDVATQEILEDTLVDVKFSGLSWKGNEGFYYSSYDKPKEGSALSGMTDQHKLYYHKLGSAQKDDKLVFGGDENPRRYIGGGVSEDGRFLIISAANTTTGNELYIKDLNAPHSKIKTMVSGFDNTHTVIHTEGDTIFIQTNLGAPNRKIVTTTIGNLTPDTWRDLISEREEPLNAATGGGYIFASYLKDVLSVVKQYNYDGSLVRNIELPGPGTAAGMGGREEDKTIYYTFTNYAYPPTIFSFDVESGKSEVYKSSGVDFDPEKYESKQVFYASKDGTKIPMMITYKKGTELNGKNPTMLYGYGGFNISLTPGFSTARIAWLEQGGVYAVANLRGGGEYGKAWHEAGTLMKKQNVFDDFIAAAEYLINENYTSSEYLGIMGGSNGGLLVGATMAQRPELVKVAIPMVGVLDMLRYHKFTAGAGWATDYGTADDSKEMFEYLLAYSPVHNLDGGTCYPATMIMTGDHDDRVVPAHSFKFAAELQKAQGCNNPAIIRIETKAGHGAGKPTSMIIEEYADIWAFSLWNMGIRELPVKLEN